ncbi:peptidase S24/S26A/S26B/S26C [Pilobolus umbonatus]|nr:peptidase S24/S26A/S26B/S26C [Pilobolus umbonatus]
MTLFSSSGSRLLRRTKYVIQFACFAHVFNQYVAEITWCLGPSMLPNFDMSGLVLIDHITQRFRSLDIGDVIICMSPAVPGRSVLKRIVGMPGDNICTDPTIKERKYITVPQGHIWVAGDNLSNSTDSRVYGPVPLGLVRGRVIAKV